jgi:hypothetical protein
LPSAPAYLGDWAYDVTKDLNFLTTHGGWKSVTMVMRYTHAGSSDLAKHVLAHDREIRGTPKKKRHQSTVVAA